MWQLKDALTLFITFMIKIYTLNLMILILKITLLIQFIFKLFKFEKCL